MMNADQPSAEQKEPSPERAEAAGMGSESIEELLRARAQMDVTIREKFGKEVAIMFTDLKESTSFFERYGDIQGRVKIQTHNDLLFPVVEAHQGLIVKTIGDAIMASFESAQDAAGAAIAMQKRLHAYNQGKRTDDQIHIRIGINFGLAMVEAKDVFGDAVNVAARVQSMAEPDDIIISESIYRQVRAEIQDASQEFEPTTLKGKEEPIKTFRLLWHAEMADELITRSASLASQALIVELTLEEDKLKSACYFKGTTDTIRSYEEKELERQTVEEACQQITLIFQAVGKGGRLSEEQLTRLKTLGKELWELFFPESVRQALSNPIVQDLILSINDRLVQVPWELVHTGAEFLCLRYNLGRLVRTLQRPRGVKRTLGRPARLLILSDPRRDLARAREEGREVARVLNQVGAWADVHHESQHVTKSFLLEHIHQYDMVHYAGHSEYDPASPAQSGWLLSDGKLTAAELTEVPNGRFLPSLIFANACQSGTTTEWLATGRYHQEIYGLANAFLLAGVQHYIGTFWEIADEPGRVFATQFYREVMQGRSVGQAVRNARKGVIDRYGETRIIWTSYMLYGDPSLRYYILPPRTEDEKKRAAETQQAFERAEVRHRTRKTVSLAGIIAAIAVAAVAAVLLWLGGPPSGPELSGPVGISTRAYSALHANQLEEAEKLFASLLESAEGDRALGMEGMSAVYFTMGDYQRALELAQQAEGVDAELSYTHVIRGKVLFNQGKMQEAMEEFRAATVKTRRAEWQVAEAYSRLGRVFALSDDPQKAAEQYALAVSTQPNDGRLLTQHAAFLFEQGELAEALPLLQKALEIDPENAMARRFLDQTQRKIELEEDKEKQARIDGLVADLLEASRSRPQRPAAPAVWASKPVTLTLLDFQARGGASLREGEEDYLNMALMQRLTDSPRVQVVERALLDKILAELKLGSSDLANPEVALRVGQILAAGVIATGTLTRVDGEVQVSLRLVDTESTAVQGAVRFEGAGEWDVERAADDLVGQMIGVIREKYPLKAEVVAVEGDQVTLNIGSSQGLTPGTRMGVFAQGDPIMRGDRVVGYTKQDVGSVEVVSVDAEIAQARVTEGQEGFKEGLRAVEVVP